MRRLVNCAQRHAAIAGVLVVGSAVIPAGAAEMPWTNAPTKVERAPGEPPRERITTDPGVLVTFRSPVVLGADDSLATESRRVKLDRLRFPPRDQLCGRNDGGRWSCGRRAATRLGALLAGRSAFCGRAADADTAILTGDCRLGGRSISETLVDEGWAEPIDRADAALVLLHTRAKTARRGLWGDGDR